MVYIVVVLLLFGMQLQASLESDLASLDVQLSSLNKLLPASKPKGAFAPIRKFIFQNWPASTIIENKDGAMAEVGNYTENVIPGNRTIIPPSIPEIELKTGSRSYDLWRNSEFVYPLISIEENIYKNFRPGVELTIAQRINDVQLKVAADGTIPNIANYIDENKRLLGVKTIRDTLTPIGERSLIGLNLNQPGLDALYKNILGDFMTQFAGVEKAEFDKWPKGVLGTEIRTNGEFKDFVQWNENRADKDAPLPERTILKVPRLNTQVVIGNRSYELWKKTGFVENLIAIKETDWADLKPDTKITIKREPVSVELVVDQNQNIANINDFIDEDNRLLGVIKLERKNKVADLLKEVLPKGLDNAIKRFQD